MKFEIIEAYTEARIEKLKSVAVGLIIALPAFIVVVTEILTAIIL